MECKAVVKLSLTLQKKTITPGPRVMRIHLVRNSTSARFEKNPKVFTSSKFIQLVQPIIHLVQKFTNVSCQSLVMRCSYYNMY